MKTKLCVGIVAACAGVPALFAAFVAGGAAYTKRIETALLSEPKALATPVSRVGFAKKLKVETVQGAWVRVTEGRNAGWVFSGNIAEEKPADNKGADGISMGASKTSATAAARPLTEAGEEYAKRKNLGSAAEDLDWMLKQCGDLSDHEVDQYLEEKKKGEFQ